MQLNLKSRWHDCSQNAPLPKCTWWGKGTCGGWNKIALELKLNANVAGGIEVLGFGLKRPITSHSQVVKYQCMHKPGYYLHNSRDF